MTKNAKKLIGMGLKTYASGMIVGAMPTMGNSNVASIQGNVLGGMSNFSSSFPTVGKLAGTAVVMKHVKSLEGGILGKKSKRRR